MVHTINGLYLVRDTSVGLGCTMKNYFDGVLEDTHIFGYPSAGNSHNHAGSTHDGKGRHTAKINVVFTNNDNGCRVLVDIIDSTSGSVLARKEIPDYLSTDEITLEVTYQGSGPTGPPTYLETLDKLDQWARPQYIPRDRR